MNSESVQMYSRRITQANRSELVVITYEIIIENIDHAIKELEDGEKQKFSESLETARIFLRELMVSLDFQYELSGNLMSLYVFMNKTIIEDRLHGVVGNLPKVREMLYDLLRAFKKAGGEDDSKPIMENTLKVYAGLTYGPQHLNETLSADNFESRGFKA